MSDSGDQNRIAIRAGGKRFNPHQTRVIATPLLGLNFTLANGVLSNPIRMQSCTNIQYIRDYNAAMGGTCDGIALAVVFAVQYSVSLPATGADPAFRATKSLHERYALSTIQVKPGKAGQGYMMSRGETSIGLLQAMLEETRCATQVMRASRQACEGYAVTNDRNALNSDSLDFGSIDNRGLVATRPMMRDEQRRIVASGTAITVPETGDQLEDIIVFPLTADGPLGVHTSGFSIESLFDATNTWEFLLRLCFDTGIYAAGAALVGDFTVTPYLVWRVWNGKKNVDSKVAAPPVFGKVWQWNNNIGVVQQGTLQTLSGPAVEAHVEVGYPPIVYGEAIANSPVPIVDGGNYFFQEIIAGSGTALKCRLMPPNVTPASLNTSAIYLQVGREGGGNTLPFAGWNLARGNEMALYWNDTFKSRAIPGSSGGVHGAPFGTHSMSYEMPLFSSVGVRTNATSFVLRTPNGSLRYGANWAAGAAVATIESGRSDSTLDLDMGGFLHYPIAFSDRETDGFSGLEVRAAGDRAGITVLTFGGFQLPVQAFGTTTPAPVNVMRLLTDYEHFKTDPCECHPAEAPPYVFNPASKDIALGNALTSGVRVISGKGASFSSQ